MGGRWGYGGLQNLQNATKHENEGVFGAAESTVKIFSGCEQDMQEFGTSRPKVGGHLRSAAPPPFSEGPGEAPVPCMSKVVLFL